MSVPSVVLDKKKQSESQGDMETHVTSLTSPDSPAMGREGHPRKGATILIIDDEEPLRFVLRKALEHADFVVREASDGREGIEEYQRDPTDMVILDLLLPDIDGVDVMLELSWDYPDVKILAITGGSGPLDFSDVAEKIGAIRTLKKPFDLDELVQTVEDVLSSKA